MDLNLAAFYDPNSEQEDLSKMAEAELFSKLAVQQGIDITSMSDEQVSQLWNYVFDKTAEDEDHKDEGEKEDKDEDEKKEAAVREHQTKLAFAREQMQADDLGKRMAHSYVAELNKIGTALMAKQAEAQGGGEATELDKEAGRVGEAVKRVRDAVVGAVKKQHGPTSAVPHKGSFAGPKTRFQDPIGAGAEAGKKGLDFLNKHKKTIGVSAGSAAVGAGAGYAAGRSKESSAIDQLALETAVKIAYDSGFDPDEAADRVAAVYTLGLEDSTKVASTVDQQVEIRALEFLEAASYPVEWAQ